MVFSKIAQPEGAIYRLVGIQLLFDGDRKRNDNNNSRKLLSQIAGIWSLHCILAITFNYPALFTISHKSAYWRLFPMQPQRTLGLRGQPVSMQSHHSSRLDQEGHTHSFTFSSQFIQSVR